MLFKFVKHIVKLLYIASALMLLTKQSFAIALDKKPQNNLEAKSKITSNNNKDEPAVLKADTIDGDRQANIITASGNVEVTKGNNILYSDKISYDKNNHLIKAIGNVKGNNIEIGKMRASEGEIKDDFSQGAFLNTILVLSDGSYLASKKTNRQTPHITVLQKPIYSLCPNPDIEKNDELAGKNRDLISIKSSQAVVDKEKQTLTARHAILRIYNFPVFYTPYLKLPIGDNQRKSGFLSPSYIKNNRFGLGAKIPYFIDIAPNADLTITPQIYKNNNQFTISNDFRHMVKYGDYKMGLEISNNEVIAITDTLATNRTKRPYRWRSTGKGDFEFNEKSSARFSLNTVGDRNYLRDYNFNFAAFTTSEAEFDYVNGRDFLGAKMIRFQELEDPAKERSAPLVLPILNHYAETKPLFYKEKLALASNFTMITREDGLQYRRLSFIPEIKLPFNIKGNLFSINTKIEGDLYSLENNFKHSARDNNYDEITSNYKPEFSINWRLPLIKKGKKTTFIIEPMANFVSSSFKGNVTKLPNEDSNNSELTVSNLFAGDRISGYDRNEAGERFSYGVKSSIFNKYGQYGLTLGQSYRLSDNNQDVLIKGFNDNNKSNFIGELSYKIPQYFNLVYSFQLNESSYRNDVNSVLTTLTIGKFTLTDNYLLLRRNNVNLNQVEQNTAAIAFRPSKKWLINTGITQDLASKRTISRFVDINYIGCCVAFRFSVTESNPSSLIKPQTSYKINVVVNGM